jgi:hypothetical protein
MMVIGVESDGMHGAFCWNVGWMQGSVEAMMALTECAWHYDLRGQFRRFPNLRKNEANNSMLTAHLHSIAHQL